MEKEDVKDDRGGILTPPCAVNGMIVWYGGTGIRGRCMCDLKMKLPGSGKAGPCPDEEGKVMGAVEVVPGEVLCYVQRFERRKLYQRPGAVAKKTLARARVAAAF